MNSAEWNQGLLLSAVLVIVGGMLLVGAASLRERLIAVGTLSQAIVVAFVTNGAFHGRSDLPLAALVLASLFALWSWLGSLGQSDVEAADGLGRAVDSPSQRETRLGLSKPTTNDPSHPAEER